MIKCTDDDSKLVLALRHDSLEAFELLYNRYKKVVYFFSLKYLFNHEDSRELVQTIFINLWEHRKLLDENRPVKSYIFRSAVNYIYNALKKKAVRRKFLLSQLNKQEDFSNPYEQIFFRDLNEKIEEIVETLSPQQQKIYELHQSKGLTCEEISDQLHLSVRTIENQIYRVNKVLKKSLRSEFPS